MATDDSEVHDYPAGATESKPLSHSSPASPPSTALPPAGGQVPTPVTIVSTSTRAKVIRGAVIGVLSFLAASLILPAATKQWSDRTAEMEIKHELISMINEAKVAAVTEAVCLAAFCIPELAPFRSSEQTVLNSGEFDVDRFRDAAVAFDRAESELSQHWATARARVEGYMDTYLDRSAAEIEWLIFADTLDAFLELRKIECGDTDHPSISEIDGYVDMSEETWSGILAGGAGCEVQSDLLEVAYEEIGSALLDRSNSLTTAVRDSNMAGYSTEYGDFVTDLWPF